MQHEPFRAAFEQAFPSTYARYTGLENEVLYVLEPDFAQKWIYQGGQPFVEHLDFFHEHVFWIVLYICHEILFYGLILWVIAASCAFPVSSVHSTSLRCSSLLECSQDCRLHP